MKNVIEIVLEFVDLIVLSVTAPIYIFAIGILSKLTQLGITGAMYAWAPCTGFIVYRTYNDGTIDSHLLEYSDLFKKH